MSDKVKLPKEVVDALDHVKHMGVHNIIECVVNMSSFECTTQQLSDIRDYYKSDWRLLIEALVNGYEVELTPEDKVLNLYITLNINGQSLVRQVLEALDMKIPGVNAE